MRRQSNCCISSYARSRRHGKCRHANGARLWLNRPRTQEFLTLPSPGTIGPPPSFSGSGGLGGHSLAVFYNEIALLERRRIPHLPIVRSLVEWLQAPLHPRPVPSHRGISIVNFLDQFRNRPPTKVACHLGSNP